MFEAIRNVTSGVTLIAFLAACYLVYQRSRLVQQRELVNLLPERDRLAALQTLAEYVHVNTDGLSKAEKTEIIMNQAEIKSQRQKLQIIIGFMIAVVAAVITIFTAVR